MRIFAGILLALIVAAVPTAKAAIIEVTSSGPDKPSIITIQGDFALDDIEQFQTKTLMASNAVVLLASDGGNLKAGIEIGKLIRLRGYLSIVPDGARCASACALAWLGGRPRMMGETALVGFHAAYDPEAGGANGETSSIGNALIGAYLNALGLPERAVIYITAAPPDAIKWLNLADAERIGLDVELFQRPDKVQQTSRSAPDPGSPSAPEMFGSLPESEKGASESPSIPLQPQFEPAPSVPPALAVAPSASSVIPSRLLNLLDRADATSVQERLRALGYLEYVSDGIWGAGSRASLRDFRRTMLLGSDDRWDSKTQNALMSGDAPGAGSRPMTLPVGAETQYPSPPGATRNPLNRSDALWLQRRLRDLGFYRGDSDGTWGFESRSALLDFKQKNALPPNETWDAATEKKLSAAVPPTVVHHGRQ
jgi:peptidoglycan hydrolase-like protein with peptidoglycan-binding domain